MALKFCTKLGWKLRKLGYERKAAARLARGCQFLMAFACRLMGVYSIASPDMHGVSAGDGILCGSPTGLFCPDVALRR